MNKEGKKKKEEPPPKNKDTNILDINNILPYSLKKNEANQKPLNSV